MACERCEATPGKLVVRHAPSGESRDLGDGVTIADAGGISTRQCPCVRDLPPVDGDATWWDSETVWERVWDDSIYPDSVVELSIDSEIPIGEDGIRRHMRGNRYYPTFVKALLPDELLMRPDQAEGLALALLAGAAKARSIDEPCEDVCGHWFPCPCRSEAVVPS
jgi:hypothetical protein